MNRETDYTKFKLYGFNRIVTQGHIDKIKKSIRENGFIKSFPVLVDRNFNIIDGQHRFCACKQLNLPIYYEMIDTPKKKLVVSLNTSHKNWNVADYVKFYSECAKNENFIRLASVMKMMKLSASEAHLMRGGYIGRKFQSEVQNGTLIFTAQDVEKVSFNCIYIDRICKNLRFKYSYRFARAVMALENYEGFSRERLLEQTEKYSTRAYKCPTYIDYVNMLIDLYNYKTFKRNLISKYMVKEVVNG